MWQETLGKFVAVSRNGEWEEFFVTAVQPGEGARLVCLTTTVDGDDFQWVAVKPVVELVKTLASITTRRREPDGVERGQLTWICCLPEGFQRWSPSGADATSLRAAGIRQLPEVAALALAQVAEPGPPVGEFGSFAQATELGVQLSFPEVAGRSPAPAPLMVAAGAAGPAGAGAIGFPGGGGAGVSSMEEMMREIDNIRNAVVSSYQEDERHQRHKKKKKKKKDKDKDKKKDKNDSRRSSRRSSRQRRRRRSSKKHEKMKKTKKTKTNNSNSNSINSNKIITMMRIMTVRNIR